MDSNSGLLRPEEVAHHIDVHSAPDRQPGFVFALVLDVLSVAAAAAFGWSYRSFLAQQLSTWPLLGVLLAFGVLTGLQALLSSKRGRRLWVLVGEVVAMSLFFYDFDPPFLTAAVLLSFVFLAWGYMDTRRELNYATEVRFWAHSRPAMGKFITATLLFMVLLYVPQLAPTGLFLPENTFAGIFNWSAGVVEKWYPGIPLAGSFGDLAQALATRQLQGNPAFEALPAQTQSSTVAENASALLTNFGNGLGTAVHASDTVATVLYGFILRTLSGWRTRFASAFLVGWSVVIFVLLRSIGILFVWLGQLLLGVVYEILLAAHVITIREEQTTKEVIGYK